MDDEPRDVRLPIMVSRTEADVIDAYRFDHRIPTRAEAIRRLIEAGLKAEAAVAAPPAAPVRSAKSPDWQPSLQHAQRLGSVLRSKFGDDYLQNPARIAASAEAEMLKSEQAFLEAVRKGQAKRRKFLKGVQQKAKGPKSTDAD